MENPRLQDSVIRVAIFTLAYMAVATGVGIRRGNAEFLIYIGVMVVLIGTVWIVHRRITLAEGALWGLSLWGLAHMAGGLLIVPDDWPTADGGEVLYTLWLIPERLKYDQVVHAFGFGITTWVCWQGIRAVCAPGGMDFPPTAGRLILAAAAGTGFGALNEVIEFGATLALPETGVGGYVNTGWDLVANLVGATVAVLLIRIYGGPTGSGQAPKREDPTTS